MRTSTDPCASRRALVAGAAVLLVAGPTGFAHGNAAPAIEVWKSPSCGCCRDWIRHVEAHGFKVRFHDSGNTDTRERLGMPLKYGSCHTGQVAILFV